MKGGRHPIPLQLVDFTAQVFVQPDGNVNGRISRSVPVDKLGGVVTFWTNYTTSLACSVVPPSSCHGREVTLPLYSDVRLNEGNFNSKEFSLS
jgi:hypothetical protein